MRTHEALKHSGIDVSLSGSTAVTCLKRGRKLLVSNVGDSRAVLGRQQGPGGALVASLRLSSILGAVAWAFSFACSGLFFPLVLGVWWKRANRQGAVAGMGLGFLAGSAYLYQVRFVGMEPWLGIDHLRFGIIGMAVSLIAMVVVSLLTEEPDAETQAMVDEIRVPGGATVLEQEQ